jgi:hypothetical protein
MDYVKRKNEKKKKLTLLGLEPMALSFNVFKSSSSLFENGHALGWPYLNKLRKLTKESQVNITKQ